MHLLGVLFSIASISRLVNANVEKTIFIGPPASTIPSEESDLDDLGLERLSPANPVVRTQLGASFPTADAPAGTDSWFFLEDLTPGQRYEVRACWLATVSCPTNAYIYALYMYMYMHTVLVHNMCYTQSTHHSLLTRISNQQHSNYRHISSKKQLRIRIFSHH